MLGLLLSFFGGPVIKGLISAYQAKLSAEQTDKKIAADLAAKHIDAEIQARANAKEVRLATAGFWEQRVITFLIAVPFVIHLLLVAVDTIFKVCSCVWPFPKPFVDWEGAILLSYFGLVGVTTGLNAIAGAVATRKGT
jgi:uncharacterized membrane protein